MSTIIRVTGAWTQLLTAWLDHERLEAGSLRDTLDRWANENVVPTKIWEDLLAAAVALRPELPAPGLAIGALIQPRHYSVMGYLTISCGTLGEALRAYHRYERLLYFVDLAQISVEGDNVEISWRHERYKLQPLTIVVAMSAFITYFRKYLSSPLQLQQMCFASPPQANAEARRAYEAFFKCPVIFADTCTRVRFPAASFHTPMSRSDPDLRNLLDRQAQALLLALPNSDAFDKALHRVLLQLLPEGTPTVQRAAQAMNISARTLQRRLDTSGKNWQTVLNNTREQLARQYLADRTLSLSDVALLLGFAEQSTFSRALRQWTGLTPKQIRETHPPIIQ